MMVCALQRMSCVIVFIADRVTPAFRFCLVNSTLTHVTPIRYFYFLLSHIIDNARERLYIWLLFRKILRFSIVTQTQKDLIVKRDATFET